MTRSFFVPNVPNLKKISPFPLGDAATHVTLTFDITGKSKAKLTGLAKKLLGAVSAVVNGEELEVTLPFAWAEASKHEAEWKGHHNSLFG